MAARHGRVAPLNREVEGADRGWSGRGFAPPGGEPSAARADPRGRIRNGYLSCAVASTAWAAASRATGTRNGEQDT